MNLSEYHDLEQTLLNAFGSDFQEADFQELALRVYDFQWRHNLPYQRYCDYLGLPRATKWEAIPAISTDAFKSADLVSFPVDQSQKCFRTSGTTRDERGKHHFLNTKLYEKSILEGWAQLAMPDSLVPVVLTASPTNAHDSSLSHMMGTLTGTDQAHYFINQAGKLEVERLLHQLETANQPLFVMGTALAFLHFMDELSPKAIPLPEGSHILETGGYKGSGRRLSKSDLYRQLSQIFSVSPDQILNEYSMTELSSQAYSRGLDQPHRVPPWMRFRIVDPRNGEELPEGEQGYLVLYDLANLGSVMAIATQDLARRQGDAFFLIGRDPSAIERGCSRAADAQLSGHL